VKFPYNLGLIANIKSVLGNNPLLWCWPSEIKSDGLLFPVSGGESESGDIWPPQDPYAHEHEETISLTNRLSTNSPWTYGNGEFNPDLIPSNRARIKQRNGGFRVPPYHPNYSRNEDGSEYSDPESAPSSRAEVTPGPRRRVGSEGLEVESIDREELLRHYIATRGDEATKAHSN